MFEENQANLGHQILYPSLFKTIFGAYFLVVYVRMVVDRLTKMMTIVFHPYISKIEYATRQLVVCMTASLLNVRALPVRLAVLCFSFDFNR